MPDTSRGLSRDEILRVLREDPLALTVYPSEKIKEVLKRIEEDEILRKSFMELDPATIKLLAYELKRRGIPDNDIQRLIKKAKNANSDAEERAKEEEERRWRKTQEQRYRGAFRQGTRIGTVLFEELIAELGVFLPFKIYGFMAEPVKDSRVGGGKPVKAKAARKELVIHMH